MKKINRKLEVLIDYICDKVPFYKKFQGKTIEEFIITNKVIIKNNYELFISEDIENRKAIIDLLLTDEQIENYVIEKKINGNIFIEWTSGSSGVPFKCLKTRFERSEISMAMWKRRMSTDRSIRPRYFLPLVHTGLAPFPFDIRDYTQDNLNKIYTYIKEKNITCLHTSPIILLRHIDKPYLKDHLPYSVKFIESTGRFLSDIDRLKIEENFNAQILNMYGTIETWEIACTCKNNNMHINSDNIYLELIDEKGNVIEEDGVQGEIIITALNQKCMPFVRYATNDFAVYINRECNCGNINRIIKLNSIRNSQKLFINNIEYDGEFIVKKVLKRIYFINVFQEISVIFLEQINENDFVLNLNYMKNEIVFEKLFITFLIEELNVQINLRVIYSRISDLERINPKNYLFRRIF